MSRLLLYTAHRIDKTRVAKIFDLNENSKLPLGYFIDHIQERRKHSSNNYLNLRLLSQLDIKQGIGWNKCCIDSDFVNVLKNC